MTDKVKEVLKSLQRPLPQGIIEPAVAQAMIDHDQKLLDQAAHQLNQMLEETAKAYGGCTNCYGKGYASVNERWHGHDTDQDIGSPGGYVSGGNPNAMKFCACPRGKELERRLNQMLIEAHSRGYSEGLKFNKGDVGAAKQLADLKAEKDTPYWIKELLVKLESALKAEKDSHDDQ